MCMCILCMQTYIYISIHRAYRLIRLNCALGSGGLKFWDDILCCIHRNHRGSVSPYFLYPKQHIWNCEWTIHHQTRPILPPIETKLYSNFCPTKKQTEVNQIQQQQIPRSWIGYCQYLLRINLFVNLSSLTQGNVIQLTPGITAPSTNYLSKTKKQKTWISGCGKLFKTYFHKSPLVPVETAPETNYESSETQQLRIVVEDQVNDRLEAAGHRDVSHNGMTGDDWNIFGKGSHNSTNLLR